MRITMQRAESMSLEQMKGFLEGSVEVEFTGAGAKEIYPWVEKLLEEGRKYERLGKAERGLVKRFWRRSAGLGGHR